MTAAARAKGNLGGRPKSYAAGTAAAVLTLRSQGSMSMADIAQACNISRRTCYRIVADAEPPALAR